MAGENAAIWQCQTGVSGTESAVNSNDTNDVLLFNDSAKIPGASVVGYISDINVDFRRAVPENEAVNDDNNEIQDMGISGFDIELVFIVGDSTTDGTTNPINKLSKWLQDGNTVTGFTKGRYGLRLDNAPHWNVTPTTTYGYHIRDVNIKYLGEMAEKCQVTLRLALGGDIASAI
jgi:hypothetical protein